MSNQERPWQFQKGRSGNPAGRPKGARNKATVVAETLLDGDADALTRAALDQAIGGDGALLRFFLSRFLAAAKHQPTPFALPELTGRPARDAANAYNAVMQAVAAGEIPVEQALRLADLIERRKEAHEAAMKEERIEAARAQREDEATEAPPPPRPSGAAVTVFPTVFSDRAAAAPLSGIAAGNSDGLHPEVAVRYLDAPLTAARSSCSHERAIATFS